MKLLLFVCVILATIACGEVEDPSDGDPIGETSSEPTYDDFQTDDVVIRNLQVRAFHDPDNDGCRAVTTNDGKCPSYEITFALQNRASELDVDRVTGATLNFNDGFPNVNLNFTCDKVPWFIEAGTSSNVIDVSFSYGDRFSDPEVSFSCGLAENSPDSFERPTFDFEGLTLGPSGPTEGTVELRLEGLMGDASDWQTSAETSF